MYNLYLFCFVSRWSSVGKIAIQSHTYPSTSSFYSANNAVDRNTDTCTRTRAIGYGPQFHVVFWEVDLERVHNIYSIDIFFLKMVTVCTRTTPKKNQKHTPRDLIAFLWIRYKTSDAILCPLYLIHDCSDIS